MRGEHSPCARTRRGRAGSSPHARGARAVSRRRQARPGIIPACAGSTPPPPCRKGRWRDHPRMRGEHLRAESSRRISSGSSPHARGALSAALAVLSAKGIIPACAGSTARRSGDPSRTRDHPRMRGEHTRTRAYRRSRAGSSPHARGAQFVLVIRFLVIRIIPACAGSTLVPLDGDSRVEDHPRMRGEHPLLPVLWLGGRGSSPHARGALSLQSQDDGTYGIIPACAGSTRSARR